MSSRHRNLEPLGRWHVTIYFLKCSVQIACSYIQISPCLRKRICLHLNYCKTGKNSWFWAIAIVNSLSRNTTKCFDFSANQTNWALWYPKPTIFQPPPHFVVFRDTLIVNFATWKHYIFATGRYLSQSPKKNLKQPKIKVSTVQAFI